MGGSSSDRAQALEPFFTTKDVGEGSGLGLPMVYGFAKQSGGDLVISSEESLGTTIKLYLPRADKSGDRTEPDEATELPRGQGETVLVIEDEPDVLSLAEALLSSLGYASICNAELRRVGLGCVRRKSKSAIRARNRHGADALVSKSALSRAERSLS